MTFCAATSQKLQNSRHPNVIKLKLCAYMLDNWRRSCWTTLARTSWTVRNHPSFIFSKWSSVVSHTPSVRYKICRTSSPATKMSLIPLLRTFAKNINPLQLTTHVLPRCKESYNKLVQQSMLTSLNNQLPLRNSSPLCEQEPGTKCLASTALVWSFTLLTGRPLTQTFLSY